MLFYFTATGNSLHAARQLDSNLISIPQVMRCGCLRRFSDDAIGVVYPIYGHRPPELVQRFLREVELETPYLYLIPTYGARHANAVDLARDICRASGKEPAYIRTLLMVDNYLPAFDMDLEGAADKNVEGQLAVIKADIAARRRFIEPVTDADRQAHESFLRYEAALPGGTLAGLVRVTDKCIGCGVCTRVCPGGCISMEEGSPRFDFTSCQGCLACAHACTQKAIALRVPEPNPGARYRNGHVTLRDIVYANDQTRN